jgi:hypothetical protein
MNKLAIALVAAATLCAASAALADWQAPPAQAEAPARTEAPAQAEAPRPHVFHGVRIHRPCVAWKDVGGERECVRWGPRP